MTKQNRQNVFDGLVWLPDRMLFRDLVFRLQHYANDNWELGNQCFSLYKIKPLVDQYAKFWSLRQDFAARNILELGMWDGGSLAFWFEYFRPNKLVGVDLQQKEDNQYFKRYKSSRNAEQNIKTYWATDQGNSTRLRQIVHTEFEDSLDLVIDDASHMYALTKKSFETLFPLLRPGGLYIIEDWAWGHWQEFQKSDHPWFSEIPLTRLIFELTAAAGSSSEHPWISNISVFQGFAVIERDDALLPAPSEFKLETLFPAVESRPDHKSKLSRVFRILKALAS
jgi:SAM-dependent methyltransferase